MRQKTDLEKAKLKIRSYIIGKNILALKFAFRGNLMWYESFVYGYEEKTLSREEFSLFSKAFGISSSDLRKVDCAVKVDGKSVWVSKIVIEEMKENGELKDVGNSYKAGSFSKAYPLDVDFLESIADDKEWMNLSSKRYDDVRLNLELIDSHLDIYQHDEGKQSKLYEREFVADEIETGHSFFDGLFLNDICVSSHDEWLRAFYSDEEIRSLDAKYAA